MKNEKERHALEMRHMTSLYEKKMEILNEIFISVKVIDFYNHFDHSNLKFLIANFKLVSFPLKSKFRG